LSACRRYFDYIILDLPVELNKVSITALNESDQIIYVVTPDSPALFGLKAAVEFFERYGLAEGERFKILVNKVSKKSDLTTKDIEKITGIPILAGIRSDYKAIKDAVNNGRPLWEKPKEKLWNGVAKDVVRLSKQLVG
jgi:pilus assembly protein CpaE